MTGITFDELYDFIEHNHEIEFTYSKEEYTIEPVGNMDTVVFEIWKYGDNPKRICEVSAATDCEIRLVIEQLLNQRCFNGRSFMEIEQEITIDTIY